MGASLDTLLGEKYVLYNVFANIPDPFIYRYNSLISFEFKPYVGQGNNMSFDIATPHEINGKIILYCKKQNRNIEAILELEYYLGISTDIAN